MIRHGTTMITAAACTLCMAAGTIHADNNITDPGIRDAVEGELIFDPFVTFNGIDVEVNNGIVSLTGTAPSILDGERATRIAESVKGVRAVIDRIKVSAPKMSGDELRRDIISALATDPATDSYEVSVKATDSGEVTLTGTVDSWSEKLLSAKVAKNVRGVTALTNDLRVEYNADRPDTQVKADIEQSLRWDALVDDGLITVNVNNGEVKLSGTAGSAAEKRHATTSAWVSGVKSVDASELKVERWARDSDLRKDKYVHRTESDIRDAVKDALMYDPRVLSFNVTPTVVGSTVILRGNVDNLKAKRSAAENARHTVGVNWVRNHIRVRPTGTDDDAKIAERVRSAIERDTYLDPGEVTTTVNNGIAQLTGTVDNYFEKARADDVASRINGVTDVRNYLVVRTPSIPLVYDPYIDGLYGDAYDWYDYQPSYTYRTDSSIQESVESELWWSPFVDSDDVNVSISNGMATLTGTVDTWSEFRAATENAYEGGATWVNNNLSVQ